MMRSRINLYKTIVALAAFSLLVLSGCQSAIPSNPGLEGISTSSPLSLPETTARSSATPTFPLSSTPVNGASPVSTPAAPDQTATPIPVFYEPAGCWQPPNEYAPVEINGHTISARTYKMLQQAATLYGGEIDVAGKAIILGSYLAESTDKLSEHSGGGAVDISVMRAGTHTVLYNEVEPLIRILRTVGFAAWLRMDGEEGPDSEIHIHALSIGDKDLSDSAQEQITGPSGYFRGGSGLASESGDPQPDRHGGPVVCQWMQAAGFSDMRPADLAPSNVIPWQERLRQASLAYLAPYPEDAEKIARSLNFLDGTSESADNICGPLSAAILRDAGLLPAQAGPIQNLKSFWQASPTLNGRPWSLFPNEDYQVFHFDTALAKFDFSAWPLEPADFVYTFAKDSGYEHMFVVTEVDEAGRAYTVTNQAQTWGHKMWGSMLILRYMLYDPQAPGEGIIYNEWSNPSLGTTGQGGFEVLRKYGLEPGSLYQYTIRPGDTLPELSTRFGAIPEEMAQANPDLDLTHLHIGQVITIPIPAYDLAPTE